MSPIVIGAIVALLVVVVIGFVLTKRSEELPPEPEEAPPSGEQAEAPKVVTDLVPFNPNERPHTMEIFAVDHFRWG